MSGTLAHLVAMANDIGDFFDGELGPADAPASIAMHLQRYWDPRMRSALIAHVAAGGQGLHPSALAAARSLPLPPGR